MKKLSAVFLIILSLLSLCSCADKNAQEEKQFYVNGVEITQDEIDFFRLRERADIISEFSSKYNVSDFSVFWETEYDGVTPQQALDKRALQSAAEAKIKFIEMKNRGIYDEITWDFFRQKAEEYNKSHEGTSTVGLKSIDMSSFYIYYLSTGEIELKKALRDEGITDYDKYITSLISAMEITE